MFLLKKLLTSLILPPAGPLLLAGILIIVAIRRQRKRRSANAALAGCLLLLASLLALSLPSVADTLLSRLETDPPISAADLGKAEAIVILGGGSYHGAPEYGGDTVSYATLERLRYGARLAKTSKLPLLVTGGAPFGGKPEAESMAESLANDFGASTRWIEAESADTAENARLSANLLRAAGVQRIALVSHAWHLRRATPLFVAQGLSVIPAPTAFTTSSPSTLANWLPSTGALQRSRYALHEMLGHAVNQLSGKS